MNVIVLTSVAFVGALLLLLGPPPAEAASARTWVASNGTNNATCDLTTPCRTFTQAHAATTAGGEINCVDAADYSPVTITKSISIVCDNTAALIRPGGGGTAIGVFLAAGDIVTLKGLDLDGGGVGGAGILFDGGGVLHVNKVRIANFAAIPFSSRGIFFRTSAGLGELYVSDSVITDNGGPVAPSGGIVVRPEGTGSVNAFLDRVRLENNVVGLTVDGSASTGVAVNAVVHDSVVAGCGGNGITATTAAAKAAVSVLVDGSRIATNFGSGINVNGAAASGAGSAIARIGRSTIVNNVTGVNVTGAGVLQSFKNNRISGNLTDGTPMTAFPGPGGAPLQ